MKDDLLLSAPHPLFLDIFCDSAISDLSCENPSPTVFTSNHSQNTPDVTTSLHYGEDTYLFPNSPNLSSFIYGNSESEHSCFQSTPIYDSLDHEDADENIKFSNHGFHDLFTHSSYHDADSFSIDLSKPLVFDDLPNDEVESPQVVKALQLKLIVLSGSFSHEVSSASYKKFV